MKVRVRTLLAIAAVGVGAVAMTISMAKPGCTMVDGKDALVISGRVLDKGTAKTFCYRDEAGRKLRFILARGTDGKVRSVMDACSQCYTYHKGFTYSDGFLICRLCGNRYPINHILEGKASCVPIAVPSTESDGKVTIRTTDLKKMEWLF
jgi:uncharacterized membrane protein